jgi:hypothetical protein
LLVFFIELASSRLATYALALALGAVLSLAAFLFSWELDLFATVVLTTYASVFILLGLLLIQFAPLGGEAASRGSRVTSLFVLIVSVVFVGGLSTAAHPGWLALSVLWQDMTFVTNEYSYASVFMHELLYRLFVWETVWANVFLSFTFVVYAVLLKVRAVRFFGFFYASAYALLTSRAWRLRWSSSEARSVHHFRRHTRRVNSSIIRHRT